MGAPNISMASASVDGVSVSFTATDALGLSDWTLDDDVDVTDFSGSVSIVLDFDEAHIGSGGTNAPYAVVSTGNLDDIFAAYTLGVNPATGVFTLTFDRDDFIGPDTATFQVSGRGDTSDNVIISFVCFAEGTLIDTADGPKSVEDLRINDLIPTKSHGLKPIRWIGCRHLNARDLAANPHMQPIQIAAGALGNGCPSRPLEVSPQHRIFIESPDLQLMFGVDAALVPAKGLVNGHTISTHVRQSVTYYHFLFDCHELVRSNGAWTESFFPGKQAFEALGSATSQELFDLFPDLRDETHEFAAAAPMLSTVETRLLASQVQ